MRKFVSKIGGQAVLEGVMMRGEKSVATAVRTPDGRIELETSRIQEENPWWKKVPILRGFLNFFSMLYVGSKVLTRSAELYGEDAEPTKLDMWLAEKSKKSAMDIAIYIGVILGVLFAIGLFVALPVGIVKLLELIPGFKGIHYVWRNLVTGGIRLIILFAYLFLVSLVPDIKRVFMYHGAEHKVITCFEQGEELTVENARKMSRLHDRCGTSFLVITVFVSLILTAFLPSFDNFNGIASFLLRFATRLALLPIVAGVAYEVLKGLAKFDNAFVRFLKKPGLWFQLLTTREPDDSMLEVSLAAFKQVLAMDQDESIPAVSFNIKKDYSLVRCEMLSDLKEAFASDANASEAEAVADWIFVKVLGVSRSELSTVGMIDEAQATQAKEYASRVKEGEPLQYVLGETEFYGIPMKTDPRALIPRGDTELLVQEALKDLSEGKNVLDLCTGSGAVAIALALKSGAIVTASDISEEALSLAKENAQANAAPVSFVQSDLFERIQGTYDMITANPPYIPTAEIEKLDRFVKREPRLALDGGADGLDFYRRIADNAPRFLKDGGILLMEIGFDQGESVPALFRSIGEVTVVKDLEGHDRVVRVKRHV